MFFSPCQRDVRSPSWIHEALPVLEKAGVGERRPCYHVDSPEGQVQDMYLCGGNQGKEQDTCCSGDLTQADMSPGRVRDRALIQPSSGSAILRSHLQELHRHHYGRATMAPAADHGDQAPTKTWHGRGPSAAVDRMVSRAFLAQMWEMDRALRDRILRGNSRLLDHSGSKNTLKQ